MKEKKFIITESQINGILEFLLEQKARDVFNGIVMLKSLKPLEEPKE